ncbi:hypothetical protein ACA910_006708 [Epithemia clementina (nom. ined.)]
MPAARLAFKSTPYEDSSPGGSFDSYLSTCSSLYSLEDSQYREPIHSSPTGSSPATQAWTSPVPVPTIVETRTSTTASPITQDNLDRVQRNNDRLTKELSKMKAQMSTLLAAHNKQPTVLPTTQQPLPTQVTPYTMDIDMIVKSVLAALQAEQALSSPQCASGPKEPTESIFQDTSMFAAAPDSSFAPNDSSHDE